MSVHPKGKRWSVRWRDATGQNKSRTFDSKRDANNWDDHVRRLRLRGELAQLDAGTEKLAEHVEEWWHNYARNLAERTRAVYASEWDLHVEPYFAERDHRPSR